MTEARPLAQTGIRAVAVAAVVGLLAAVHFRRPATLCFLRATTGVPCPFCGGTTAAVDLGRGRLSAALAASPLALLMLAGWALVGVVREPVMRVKRSRRIAIVLALLAMAEIWQLHRFGLIHG